MKSPLISIVIPFRKEEKNIITVFDALKKNVKTPFEILAVDDCVDPGDKTNEIVNKYRYQNPEVKLVPKTINNQSGFSGALYRGAKSSHGKAVVFVMADLCDDPKTIDKMWEKINQGYDLVSGSRYMAGGGKSGGPQIQGFFSKFVGKSLNFLIRIPTKDSTNAFKMYTKNLLDKLHFDTSLGFEVSMDLTIQAYFKHALITEIPTFWRGRKTGESKFKLIKSAPKYINLYLKYLYKYYFKKIL